MTTDIREPIVKTWTCGDCGAEWTKDVPYCRNTLDDYLSLRGGSIESAIRQAVTRDWKETTTTTMPTESQSARERVAEVLRANGLSDRPGELDCNIHHWRCEYPDVYGECKCFSNLIDDLFKALPQLAEEPEWEYRGRTDYGRVICEGSFEDIMNETIYMLERRRKAGEWEEVK